MINLDRFISSSTAVLICTNVNRFYLSGMKSSAGYMLISQVGNFLLVDGRYYEAALKKVYPGIKVVLLERLSKQLNDLVLRFGIKTLYTETEITVSLLSTLNSIINCNIKAEQSLTDDLYKARSVKSEKEIENIIAAQRIAEASFEELLNFIKAGVSEKDIALQLDFEMQKRGSEWVSFETVAVSGENSSLPHGVPGERLLKAGDFLTLDFGAVYGGYHSDMTRTVAIGHVTDKMQQIYDLVLTAQCAAIDKVKAGVKCNVVDAAARDIITKEGFAGNFNHSTGHGVGLEIHEYPNLSNRSDDKLIAGQVVTCEPGIYLQGIFGVRIEDMVVVRENATENLTNSPKTLIIL